MTRFLFTKRKDLKWLSVVDVFAIVALVVVLFVVAGCQALVVRLDASGTASDALQKTVPSGDRVIPLRSVCPVPSKPTIHLVNPDDVGILYARRLGVCDSDL